MGKVKPHDGSRLVFYWYELPSEPAARRDRYWGELIGAAHGLGFVGEEFAAAGRVRNLRRSLEKLEYAMQNYFGRVYELRERALLLVNEGLPGHKKKLERLKKPELREAIAADLLSTFPNDIPVLLDLFALLDGDIGLRNQHTHTTFLHVGLNLDGGLCDPDGLLLELEARPRPVIEKALRGEIRLLVNDYSLRIAAVIAVTMRLLELHDQWPRGQ